MFTQGSKSEKLAECFDMFDHNGSGDLSKRTFQRYLNAILTALMQWTEGYWDGMQTIAFSICNQLCVLCFVFLVFVSRLRA